MTLLFILTVEAAAIIAIIASVAAEIAGAR